MKLKIIHETNYAFESGVFLEPHILRFRPKNTAFQTLEHFELVVFPKPAGLSCQTDEEGNLIHLAWFDGLTHELNIQVSSVVEATSFNPFNFLVSPDEFLATPFTYSADQKASLNAAMSQIPISKSLVNYGEKLLLQTKHHTVNFVIQLTRQIHNDFLIEERLKGAPHSPGTTFDQKKGSCRDVSWMQIQLLRHFGIAARFVSGYYFLDEEATEFELHGWLEIFLPGAGWIGLDPSHGILTGDHHIPVSSSAFPQATMPVTGTTRGKGVAEMTTQLMIKILPELKIPKKEY